MATKSIKHANKGNIIFLSNSNYDQLYSSILFALGKNAPFAPLTIQGSTLSWSPAKSGNYRSITEAPDELLGTLGMLWEQTKKELRPKLSAQDLDFVLEVPDLSYIFYAENASNNDGVINHRFQLLITGWACQKGTIKSDEGDDGMTTRIHEAQNKLQNVIARMVDETGQPIANGDFIYTFGDSIVKDEKTDMFGTIGTGLCVVGSKLTYTYKLTGQTKSITVQKNIETYTITFAPTTDFSIRVVDQHDKPLQAHMVKVEYGSKTFTRETDGLGETYIENVLYIEPSLQVTITVEGYESDSFPVTCPKCDITMRVEVKDPIKPYLKIIRDGGPVSGHSVTISGKITGTYASNAEGIISLDGLQEGDTFNVKSASETEADLMNYMVVEEQQEYIYELPITHIDDGGDTDIMDCHVKVLRRSDNKPISEYSLRFESISMNGVRLTDVNGIIPIENVAVGTTVKIFKSNFSEPEEILIEKGKVEYVIFVDEERKQEMQICHVKIIDENGMAVQGLSVKIESSKSNGYHVSDENGLILVGELIVGEEFKCNVPAENQNYTFMAEKGKEEYIISIRQKPEEKKMDCHIKVVEGPELIPVGNFSLRIESDTMHGYFLTDTYGVLPLENMSPGMRVSCYVEQGQVPFDFTIEEEKEEYLVQIEKKHDITNGDIMVTLVDRDRKTPVTPAIITLTNRKGEKFTQRNDYKGNIIVPKNFFKDGDNVHVHAENENKRIRDCKFKYTKDCDHYIVYLTEPRSWKWLMWLFLLPLLLLLSAISCERDIIVHTIDTKGQNVTNAVVRLKYNEHALYKNGQFFYNRSQQMQGITDDNGYYTFKDTPCSIYSYIFYCFQKALVTGSRNATSEGSTLFFYHWRKNVDIIITNSKLVQVRSSKTNQPIHQARVDINKREVDKIDSTMYTDVNGLCRIKANCDSPILHLAQLTATKTGYSGTRLMDIEIDENDSLPLIVYLDEPEPCQDQETNNNDGNQGDMAMRDYDMGKQGGEFIFNYYTDSAPDDISIYDGSSSDYVNGTAPRIFHYEGATCTTSYQHSENVKYTSRYVCVIVKGGTNWGYVVQCPYA